MTSRKSIAGFVLRLVLLGALLLIPWPGLQDAYGRLFCSTANVVFGSFGSHGVVRFKATPPPAKSADEPAESSAFLAAFREAAARSLESDIAAGLSNRRTKSTGITPPLHSRRMGYIPTALVVMLVLATPTPWHRRAWAMLWGLLLVHAFVGLKIYLMLLNEFSAYDRPIALYTFSQGWKAVLRDATLVITFAPWASYTIPVLIWIIATFRRRDLEAFRTVAETSGTESTETGDESRKRPNKRRRHHRK
jgi:hypothetical protein